jgi:hypothetical protein
MKRATHALAVIRRSDPEPVEWLLGLLMAAYGAWLIAPWTTWTVYKGAGCESGAYELIRRVWATEEVQGAAFVVVGCGHAVSAFWGLGPRRRIGLAIAAAAMWSITWASFVVWRWQSTAVPVYAMHALAHVWLVWRHAIERRVRRGRR